MEDLREGEGVEVLAGMLGPSRVVDIIRYLYRWEVKARAEVDGWVVEGG